MKANPGRCPMEAIGKRVIVKLASGALCGREPVSATAPAGWAADGRQGCRWTLTGQASDIAFYEVLP